MDRTRRSIFGHGELDRYSLAEVVALKVSAGLECRKCYKFAAIDIDELARQNGCQFTLGEVRRLARCRRCRSKLPFLLIRSQAIRGDRAWYALPARRDEKGPPRRVCHGTGTAQQGLASPPP